MKVVILKKIANTGIKYLKEKRYEVVECLTSDKKEIAQNIKDADGIIVRFDKLDGELLSKAKKLKVIGRHGVGVDNIDLQYCKDNGIIVTNTPLANFNAVCEHTMYLLLALAKNARFIDGQLRKGNFEVRHNPGVELKGKTLGIIGLGRIGSAVAKKAYYGFDMKVIAYDNTKKVIDDYIKMYDNIYDIAKNADFISVHVPLNGETLDMIDEKFFSSMKNTAYFINCARAQVVNEEDLINALKDKLIAGAGLDVISSEPQDINNPLFAMDNVIITPHYAAHTFESFDAMSLDAAKGVDEVLSGKDITYRVV